MIAGFQCLKKRQRNLPVYILMESNFLLGARLLNTFRFVWSKALYR
jgi:hypothetical protein